MKRLAVMILVVSALLFSSITPEKSEGATLAAPDQCSTASQAARTALRYGLADCIQYALQDNDRSKVSRDVIEMALALHQASSQVTKGAKKP